MSVIKYTALLLVLLVSAIAAQDQTCGVSLLQEKTSTWSDNGITYSIYEVRIKNDGYDTVRSVEVFTTATFVKIWRMDVVAENKYALPAYIASGAGVGVGGYHQFGYTIQSESPAEFFVSCAENVVEDVVEESEEVEQEEFVKEVEGEVEVVEEEVEGEVEQESEKSIETRSNRHRPTKKPTSRPTKKPTTKPTKRPTTKPTKRPTTAPTKKPTKAPTNAPTKAPTTAPTKKPTSAPTTKPTTKPTSAATTKPTAAPTTKPTTPTSAPSAGGKICPAGTWWQPAPGTTWQWVISTTPDTSLDVQMYDIDLFSASATTVKKLHDAGRAVICYFSTQYEDWRPDAKDFPSSALGSALDDWEGERYVDIRSSAIRKVMQARLDLAVSKGCDGVEPDNVDGYSSSTGFPIKAADQLEYNKFLAAEAHKRGLSIGLKNDLSQVAALQPSFDWALNEECYAYSECDRIKPFIDANKAVFSCEYAGTGSKICPYMNNLKFSGLIKEHLDNSIKAQCCTYQEGGCAKKASYRCVSE